MITPEMLSEAGYQRTNNIHSYPGTVWTVKGQGVWEPKEYCDSLVLTGGGGIRIMRATLEGRPYIQGSYYSHEQVRYFEDLESMIAWLTQFGKQSGPGLPAWSQGNWD